MTNFNRANTLKSTFSRTTTITTEIYSNAARVWILLTQASNYPNWNSTIIHLKGKIEEGERIWISSTLDASKEFKLKVIGLEEHHKMIWKGSMGRRVFTLEESEKGTVLFTMTEKIGGPFFPLFARLIPSFDKPFEQFASDLKRAAEK